jgi:arylsulfatase A-like enzyme
VITADHGESLGEHGFGHGLVYDEVVRVPLILAGPGISQGVGWGVVGAVDIAPTIVAAAGGGPVAAFVGKPLLPLRDGGTSEAAVSIVLNHQTGRRLVACRRAAYKYIRTETLEEGRLLSEQLFDLSSDPGETIDISAREQERLRLLEQDVVRHLAAAERGQGARESLRERIRKLKETHAGLQR